MSPKAKQHNVFVYADTGVSRASLLSLLSLFQAKMRGVGIAIASVATISSDEIVAGGLIEADCLIIPGGADLPYCDKLNGAGNREILAFIAGGGFYIGICAGGYYGASSIHFTGDGYCIQGDRELGLFKGQAIGSIADFTEGHYYDEGIASKSIVSLVFSDSLLGENKTGDVADFYYHGGAYFGGADDATCIAKYSMGNCAAVAGTLGQGKYLLTGVHFELCPDVYVEQVLSIDKLAQLTQQEKNKEQQLLALLRDRQYGEFFYRTIAKLLTS